MFPDVYIPYGPDRLLVNNLMFSNERRLCAPDL